jgi:hypothetical protein
VEHVACFQEINEVFDSEWEVFLSQGIRVFRKAMREILGGNREVSLRVLNSVRTNPVAFYARLGII